MSFSFFFFSFFLATKTNVLCLCLSNTLLSVQYLSSFLGLAWGIVPNRLTQTARPIIDRSILHDVQYGPCLRSLRLWTLGDSLGSWSSIPARSCLVQSPCLSSASKRLFPIPVSRRLVPPSLLFAHNPPLLYPRSILFMKKTLQSCCLALLGHFTHTPWSFWKVIQPRKKPKSLSPY